jgi:dTMP kinase
MTSRPGRFITLEGGEGAGKSTQQRLLAEALTAGGLTVTTTREPGGSPGAEEIRGLLLGGAVERWDAHTETLLLSAARRDHLVRRVWPALERGEWVISDRFADSTSAYQGAAQGIAAPDLAALYRFVAGDFTPDLTLILDLPIELGLARAAARAGISSGSADRFEARGPAFHEQLRQGFLAIAEAEPQRCAVIDAARSVEIVARDILDTVAARLGIPR